MSPLQALVAATANGAENLGLTDVGFVREGFVADLALWDENPVDDASVLLRAPRAVYQAGVRVTPLRD
jgi:imidazolonepropionase-like amidohydrolase